MYKWICFTICSTLISFFAFASQNNQNSGDSLIYNLNNIQQDTNKVKALIRITDELNEVNYDKAIYYGKKAISLAKKLNYYTGISTAYHYLGVTYYYKADYKSAMITVLEKMKYDEKENNQLNIANNYNFIGNIYYQIQEYDKAYDNYLKCLKIYKKLSYKSGLSSIYNNLGNIYESNNEPEKAEENYLLSLNIDKQLKRYQGIIITNNNLGNLYYKQFKDSSGINYFYKALYDLKYIDNPNTSALVFQNIGDYYIWVENYDSAFFYLDKAFIIANKYNLPFYKKDIAQSLSKIYERFGNYKQAFAYQSLYQNVKDSLYNLNNSAKLTLLEYQYEQEKKQIEQNLLFLKQQRKNKTIIWIISITFIITVAITILFIIYQKSKIRESKLTEENTKIESNRLKEQLQYRNKEIVLMTMNLFERNKLISTVINKLNSMLPKAKKTNYNEIENIIRELRSNYHENILKEFEFRFNKVHINFYKNLKDKYSTLTSNELRLCAFLKMNMSSKDIASLTHQSINSIEVARTRLRKKLNLNNVEIDLVKFLASF